MRSETFNQIRAMFVNEARAWPSAVDFEMAYQARGAMDRIRFAIKHTEHFAPQTNAMREVSLQLLDALERLQMEDRRFQERSRAGSELVAETPGSARVSAAANGGGFSHGPTNGASDHPDGQHR